MERNVMYLTDSEREKNNKIFFEKLKEKLTIEERIALKRKIADDKLWAFLLGAIITFMISASVFGGRIAVLTAQLGGL